MMHQLLIEQRLINNRAKVVAMPGVSRRPTVLSHGAALLMTRAKRFNNDPGLRQHIAVLENRLAKSVEHRQALKHQLSASTLELTPERKKLFFPGGDCEEICPKTNSDDDLNDIGCLLKELLSAGGERLKTLALENAVVPESELRVNNLCQTLQQQKAALQKKLDKATCESDADYQRLRNEMADQQKELQNQLEDCRQQLDSCEGRLSSVTKENEHFKQSEDILRSQVEKAQSKETGFLSQMRDLQQKHNELQMCVADQNKKLQDKTDAIKKLETMKMDLEQQLESEQLDHRLLQARYAAMQMERDNHLQQLRLTLEEAAKEKRELHEKFDKEYEYLRNRNSERDHQLMDDYEWKLREIERDYKAKMDSERKKHQDAMEKSKDNLEKQLENERQLWTKTKDALTSQLEELRLQRERQDRSSETELRQLRGLTQELQIGIKASASNSDEMRLARDITQDELDKLEIRYQSSKRQISKLQSEICDIKESHSERLKTLREQCKNQVEESRTDSEGYWKDHFREEYAKWQVALEKEFEDDKQFALETLQTKKNTEISQLQEEHEQQAAEYELELQTLRDDTANITAKLKVTELEHEGQVSILEQKFTEKADEVEKNKADTVKLLQLAKSELETEQNQQDTKYKEELQKCSETHRIALEELEKKCVDENQSTLDQLRSQMEMDKKQALEDVIKMHRNNLQMMRQEFDKAVAVIKQKDKYIKDLEKEFHYRELQTHELQLTSESLEKRLKEMELHQQSGEFTSSSQNNPEHSRVSDTSPGCVKLTSCCPRPMLARPKVPQMEKRASRQTCEMKRESPTKSRINEETESFVQETPTPMRRKKNNCCHRSKKKSVVV